MVSVSTVLEITLIIGMSIQDLKSQEIHIALLSVFLLIGMTVCVLTTGWTGFGSAFGYALGIFVVGMVVRIIVRGGIGFGDIWILSAMPFWEKGVILWEILILSMFLSGLYSVIIHFRKRTQKSIAYIPWLGIAVLVMKLV